MGTLDFNNYSQIKRKCQENAGPSPAKKKRTKTTEIQLENAPQDEVTLKVFTNINICVFTLLS